MSFIPSNQCRLEILPNELLIEVFQHLNCRTLREFQRLNQRFKSIISCLNVCFVLQDESDDFNAFNPTQIVRVEMNFCYQSLNFQHLSNIRSLSLDYTYMTKEQIIQITQLDMFHLERLSIENIMSNLGERLLHTSAQGEHFPSLRILQLGLNTSDQLQLLPKRTTSNNRVRCLIINRWKWSRLHFLLEFFPHLSWLEINLDDNPISTMNLTQSSHSLTRFKITLEHCDPYHSDRIFHLMPNLIQLCIRANIGTNLALVYFVKLAKCLSSYTPNLQYFDCEIYCYTDENENTGEVIRKYHQLFKQIRCLRGEHQNRCFATDMQTYPYGNQYEIIRKPVTKRPSLNKYGIHYSDSDDNDDDMFFLKFLADMLFILFLHLFIFCSSAFDIVQLADEDLRYLNERLQLHDHMSREDALNSIIELEHFYTGLKNDLNGSPSEMVDKAWHAHILNTKMYFRFSELNFGRYLHHLPFWSGNQDEAEELNEDISMLDKLKILGIQNMNETVWTLQLHETPSSDGITN
ncbi:unnamed protein product [Adineta ricciae]|uniref:F-box domain-containing protein n=2 Tax=Adineta ricciae TaxID=249248 RepID=A0A813RAQ5_ADIRI|nr:unnamed protein product [Adineta ricciae]